MLAILIAAALAAQGASGSDQSAPAQTGAAQAAPVQTTAPVRRKSRLDDVICKSVQVPGIGTTRQACATRREWNDREAVMQQELRARQTGFCGGGALC